MVKIAYITLHKVRNYGSVLQTYATKKVLEKLGHEAELIEYCSPRFVEENRVNDEFRRFGYRKKNNPLIKGLFYTVMSVSLRKQKQVFDGFLGKYIPSGKKYYDIEQLRADPPQADVYCTGSDQVWNFNTNGFFERPFYLDFGPEGVKRIAFSASFGRNQLNDGELEQIQEPLRRYAAIGLREKSSLPILEHIGVKNAINTLDPTLTMEVADWQAMTQEKSPYKEKYILIYEFNKSSNIGDYAKELSRETGLPIKRIAYWCHKFHKGEKRAVLPSVEEFLNLIRHAEYVLTDSFHASVFSTVFKKQFAAIYPEYFSVRLDDFLKLTNMSERHIARPEEVMNITRKIDFDAVHEILAQEREKTLLFLQKHILGE